MTIGIAGAVSGTGQALTSKTTPARTTTAGCALVAIVEWYTAGGVADCTISDSKGNTWTAVAASTSYQSNVRRIKAWVCQPTTVGASHTFTATRGDSNYTDINICVVELSSPAASALDLAAFAVATGASAAPSVTSGTLAQADTAVVAALGWWNTPTVTNDAAFTQQANLDSGGDDEKMMVATRVVAATTPVTFAPTLSASTNWVALVVPIKGAAAAPPPSWTGYRVIDQQGAVGSALVPYDISGKVSGGTAPLTFTALGAWPAGVSVTTSGVIQGTPTTEGVYNGLKVRVTDALGNAVDMPLDFGFVVWGAGLVVGVRRSVGSNGDYPLPQAWNNAAPASLVAWNIVWQGECLPEEFVIADGTYSPNYAVNLSGSTTDATRYKHLTTVAGGSFRDHANRAANPLRYNASAGSAIRFTAAASAAVAVFELGTRITGLQIKHTGNTGFAVWTSQLGKTVWTDNIIEGNTNYLVAALSGAHDVIRCAVIATNPTAISHIAEGTAGVSWYSCVIASVGAVATYGLIGGANSGTADGTVPCDFVNTAVFGCGQLRQWNSPGTITNCFTNAATRPAGFGLLAYDISTGSGFQSITSGTHDFRLKPTSALVNAGAVDSVGGAVDVLGTARPGGSAYDVGPYELPFTDLFGQAAATASASGAITLAVPLVGAALSQASAVAGLAVSKPLQGSAAVVVSAAGSVSLEISLTGAAIAEASAAASFDGVVQLSGAAAAVAGASGALVVSVPLTAQAIAQAQAAGALVLSVALSGAAQASASAGGVLSLGSDALAVVSGRFIARAAARNYAAISPRRNWSASAS